MLSAIQGVWGDGLRLSPGIFLCATVGLAAQFIANEYGAPVMLLALLLGGTFNFLAIDERCELGINFCAKRLLRAAVALLGLQISFEQVMALGPKAVLFVCLAVAATIGFGLLAARVLGLHRSFGFLTGGSVAICGASAALAINSVLPASERRDDELLLTVVAVTSLSTVAMILYPILCRMTGLDDQTTGFFLGATIHDVAQVVGAGYSHSEDAGEIATFTKMLRVAMLIPIVSAAAIFIPSASKARGNISPRLPWFLFVFAALFLLNSVVSLSNAMIETTGLISRAMLVLAITALGIQTSLQKLTQYGWRPLGLVVVETLFLASIAGLFIAFSDTIAGDL
jgi:uncharacterized integral membrane protein (TIGR00698 family)